MTGTGNAFAALPVVGMLYIALCGLAGMIWIFSIAIHWAFLNRYKSLDGEAEITAYKKLVRGNMHKVLAVLIILVTANVFGLLWFLSQGAVVFLPMVAVNFTLAMLGMAGRRFERYAASLPTGNDVLEAEYNSITASGQKSFLPDF